MERILVCLDRSPTVIDVYRAALDIARVTHARLTLFRVLPGTGELPETDGALVAIATAELDDIGKASPPEVWGGSEAVIGETPWRAICDAARKGNVNLIVIGAHAHGPVARALGTTAASVVNHADGSVLVVRSPEERTRG